MLRKVTTYQSKMETESLIKKLSVGCFYEVQTIDKQSTICVYDVDFASLQKFLSVCLNVIYSVRKKMLNKSYPEVRKKREEKSFSII